ncbi:hypothetical protein J4H86_07355 [Spiractinospora alimapuensis]|uniref:baeRF2 domain-containing protein n=1 Tax=Spiractinospora alimapuensis TaxID=2820884 RepID=UPI001F28C2C3|nr:Vms1/Ankzf1 family peptidyl-tRNA hydrolase [Spiractinospora alimapuensis]QVQ53550.1 hypothetical protein J4H86_07355 [Spiractinospora alimapuensis]
MDLSELETLYGVGGPVLSLHINVSRDAEDADHAIGLRWENARRAARADGAGEDTVAAVDEIVGQTRGIAGPHGQAIFAADGRVLDEFPVASTPPDYDLRVGPLADPMLYLRGARSHVPFVLGVVDSRGADLTAEYPSGHRVRRQVVGEDKPTHKVREGGYHHNQMQRAVDERVKQNLKKVAQEVSRYADRADAEVVAIAGEVGLRGELADLLPRRLRGAVVDVDTGARASGSEESPLNEELDRRLAEQEESHVAAVVAEFERGRGADDRVAEGTGAIVRSLRRGQVGTLLWAADLAARDDLWIGPGGQDLAVSDTEARDLGIQHPERETAEAALLRAAVATSADLVFVAPDRLALQDGVGALLRF